MATFVKFHCLHTDIAAGTHANALNASTDTLKVYLTNATPDQAADSVKADLAEISAGNGYTAGGVDIQNSASKSTGTITVTATDLTVTATGGAVGPFRYAVIYNDTSTSDSLWGYYDYGSAITLNSGESFTVDFCASLATF
jgi:hypothetical protein